MSLSPTCYLLKPERLEPASSAASWLGRIVQHYAVPDAEFTPDQPSQLLTAFTPSETKIADVKAFMNNSVNGKLDVHLAGLTSAFRNRAGSNDVEFSTTSVRHVRLQKHNDALKAITSDNKVMQDLAEMLKPGGDPAYFIVGMLIWEDAKFTDGRTKSQGAGISADAPISAAVAATTGVVIPEVDSGITAESEAKQSRSISGSSQGSSIFAFEYRTVRRRIFSIGKDFTPKLGGYGGRIEKDRVFGHSDANRPEALSEAGPVALDDDEDGLSWADLAEEELDTESIGDIMVAFD